MRPITQQQIDESNYFVLAFDGSHPEDYFGIVPCVTFEDAFVKLLNYRQLVAEGRTEAYRVIAVRESSADGVEYLTAITKNIYIGMDGYPMLPNQELPF